MGARYPKCSLGWIFLIVCWFKLTKSAKVTSLDWHWRSRVFSSLVLWPDVALGPAWPHLVTLLQLYFWPILSYRQTELMEPNLVIWVMPEWLFSYHIFSLWIWQILPFCQIIELGYFNKLETLDVLRCAIFLYSCPWSKLKGTQTEKSWQVILVFLHWFHIWKCKTSISHILFTFIVN